MRKFLIRLDWFFSTQLGLNFFLLVFGLLSLPRFAIDALKFKKEFGGRMNFVPALHDRFASAGAVDSEYFWQDLFVAQRIFKSTPRKHVDVGSRVDGFISNVASFREIEVFDIRAIRYVIPNVSFKQVDIMNGADLIRSVGEDEYCDSLSCLHALEHFGLGRYGDPITPSGYKIAFQNLSQLLQIGGVFYLAVPVGTERVEFNANWVFDPRNIANLGLENNLNLIELVTFDSTTSGLHSHAVCTDSLDALSSQNYTLAIFIFKKTITAT